MIRESYWMQSLLDMARTTVALGFSLAPLFWEPNISRSITFTFQKIFYIFKELALKRNGTDLEVDDSITRVILLRSWGGRANLVPDVRYNPSKFNHFMNKLSKIFFPTGTFFGRNFISKTLLFLIPISKCLLKQRADARKNLLKLIYLFQG